MSGQLHHTFAALAQPHRLAVVRLLREGSRRSGDMAEALCLSRPAMSRHLRVLRRAGLVDEHTHDDDARGRSYHLVPEAFFELRGWLDEVEAFWEGQLDSFKTHAEAQKRKH